MSSVPDFPWGPLELDPTTATERDVKRAYARLIKVHRPDTDPEGFRHVHEAYQAALHTFREPEEIAGANPPANLSPAASVAAPAPLPVPLPEEFSRKRAAVQQMLATNDLTALAFGDFLELAFNRPELGDFWEDAIFELFDQNAILLAQLLDPADFVRLLGAGKVRVTALVEDVWYQAGTASRTMAVAELLLSQPAVEGGAAIQLQLRIARDLAFAELELAQNLTNFLFPHVEPQARATVLPQLENRFLIANIFERLPFAERRFWEWKIYGNPSDPNRWNRSELAPRFVTLRTFCVAGWSGYEVLRQSIPKDLFNDLIKSYPPRGTLHPPSPRRNKIYAGIGLLLAVLCIWGWARFIRAKSAEDSSDAAIVAQMIPLMDERNRLLRKMRATKVNGLVASPEALELERLNRLIEELDKKREAVLAQTHPTQ